MLRNVLEDYLNSAVERDFDYPLMSLLQAMNFYDIHFTHGGVEFGKDFIAKRIEENGIIFQYAIQSKRGDIKQNLWRNEIRGQLEEAVLSDLSHPQFDTNLPRKAVLVTTGRLSGNARLAAQEFKRKLEDDNKIQELIFWEKEQLIQFSEEFGLSGIYQNTAIGSRGFAQFYLIYSKAIEGSLSDREIEEFSRLWSDENLEYRKRILRASLETEIIASKLVENGRLYEAAILYLSLARTIMQMTYENDDEFVVEIYKEITNKKIIPLCDIFFNQIKSDWQETEKSLIHLCLRNSSFPMLHYVVWCARILELNSLYFFLTNAELKKNEIVDFLIEFIEKEEGCGHIPGDRYAVTMVWVILALVQSKNEDKALQLLKKSTVWLCDRVEKGFGLARYEADEYGETITLLGYPFDFIKVDKNRSSFLATILADLAAFVGNKEFYADVINDFEACEISYNYWQFPDTKAIFEIETEECRAYPNIPHQHTLNTFEDFDYSEHIKLEPQSFRIVDKLGKPSLILLSVLLKDRYFPTMWKQIILPK
jgi:hypothetical protein